MAANAKPIFVLTPSSAVVTVVNADSTDKKTIATAGAAGARYDSIAVSSNDTAAVNLAFYVTVGGTDYHIGNVAVPIGAGYTTVARVDAISTLAPVTGYLALAASAVLKCNAVAAVTADKTVTVAILVGGDY